MSSKSSFVLCYFSFSLQAKLARVFKKGLLNAARTTGAWIITNGINSGVVQHVSAALADTSSRSRANVVSIGIAPWGLLKVRSYHTLTLRMHTLYSVAMISSDVRLLCHIICSRSRLEDDWQCSTTSTLTFYSSTMAPLAGSFFAFIFSPITFHCHRYGADILLRKKLEEWISQKVVLSGSRKVPVVCVVLEGGE